MGAVLRAGVGVHDPAPASMSSNTTTHCRCMRFDLDSCHAAGVLASLGRSCSVAGERVWTERERVDTHTRLAPYFGTPKLAMATFILCRTTDIVWPVSSRCLQESAKAVSVSAPLLAQKKTSQAGTHLPLLVVGRTTYGCLRTDRLSVCPAGQPGRSCLSRPSQAAHLDASQLHLKGSARHAE